MPPSINGLCFVKVDTCQEPAQECHSNEPCGQHTTDGGATYYAKKVLEGGYLGEYYRDPMGNAVQIACQYIKKCEPNESGGGCKETETLIGLVLTWHILVTETACP